MWFRLWVNLRIETEGEGHASSLDGTAPTGKETEVAPGNHIRIRRQAPCVIFVPPGDEHYPTREPESYDGIYKYLKEIGFSEI